MTSYLREKKKRLRGSKVPSSREGEVRALIYCRVSSDRQASEGHGLESQEQRCISFVEQRGYTLEKVFKDAASGGGGYTSRPGQVALLQTIDKFPHRKFVVIVDDISRIARDVRGHFELRAILRAQDVPIESPNYEFNDTDEGEVMETVMASFSQYHRKSNRRQVIQKMKARLEKGYWTFGSKKGYDMLKNPTHGKLAVPNNEGLKMLKPAFERFADGTLVRKIDVCRFLVDCGFWKKQRPDKYIDKLVGFMKDPFYCGDIVYPQWEISRRAGQHEGIISIETYDRMQVRLRKENAGARIRVDISPEFPLRGLLICSECGRHLTGAWTKGHSRKYAYYYCQYRECPIYSKMLKRDSVQDDFHALLERNCLKKEVADLVTLVFDRVWDQEVQSLKQREAADENEARQMKEKVCGLSNLLLGAGNKSEAIQRVFESQLEETAVRLQQLEHQIAHRRDLAIPYRTALEKATGMLRKPVSIWDSVDTLEKHRLFFFLFETKLAYAKETGYRTAESLSKTRLFEEFAVTNPLRVEVRGIEPRSESIYESVSTTHSQR